MSNALQQKRDSLHAGDEVEVLTRYGTQVTKRAAVIVTTVRAAARCRFEDGAERMIAFKDIVKVEKDPVPPPPVVEVRRPSPPLSRPLLGEPIANRPPPGAPFLGVASDRPAPAPAAPKPKNDLDAWLQMGRELLEPIEVQISMLSAENRAYDEEIEACEREIEAAKTRKGTNLEELKKLHAQREQISKLTGRAS